MKYNFRNLFAVLILCYFLIKKKVSKKNLKLSAGCPFVDSGQAGMTPAGLGQAGDSFLLTYFNQHPLKYFTVSFVFINKNYKQVNDRASKNN